ELTEQGIAVFLSPSGKLSDEGFNLSPRSVFEGFDAAEIDGVSLYEIRVELMLADHLAKVVTDRAPIRPRATRRPGHEFRRLIRRLNGLCSRAEFLDRAQTDAVRLAKSSVDRASFRNSQLRTAEHGRNIGGIGITVA